ncbi:MAG: glutathione S-transferase family protein [Rhodospirillaceae bacterium]|nr:glutathione S-transferase family protein [Rhodospirillaceae bacterium]
MIELHFAPGNANLAPHFILEELGLDFKLTQVDRSVNAHKSPAYLKLNPSGRIPVLVDGDLVLFEAAAICLHLVDTHPTCGLAPALGTPERAHFYKWLMFLTNTIQPDILMYYYSDRYTTDPDGGPAVKEAAENRLIDFYTIIDHHLAKNGPYLLGETFSAADYYLLMVARFGRSLKTSPRDMTHLGATLEKITNRDAVQRAFASEGIEAPFL